MAWQHLWASFNQSFDCFQVKEQLSKVLSHSELEDNNNDDNNDDDGDDDDNDDVQPVFFLKQEEKEEDDVMCEQEVAGNSSLPVDPIVVTEESCSGALFEAYRHLPPPAGSAKYESQSTSYTTQFEKKRGTLTHTLLNSAQSNNLPYSGGQLECRLDNCGFIIQTGRHVGRHWKTAHSGRHSLAEAVFFDAPTGKCRGLFELFPHVVVCRGCETIRKWQNNGEKSAFVFYWPKGTDSRDFNQFCCLRDSIWTPY